MHISARRFGHLFFKQYAAPLPAGVVVEVGACGSEVLREACPKQHVYRGIDMQEGPNVDLVTRDPYALPLRDGSVDAVVSSSCFEHVEMFWLLFLEVMRVLKPAGLLYLNVPSNGMFHQHPVDCWRFYPDSGRALARWARRNRVPALLLESFTGRQQQDQWNDFVAVFLRDAAHASLHPRRILDVLDEADFTNGLKHGVDHILSFAALQEDQERLRAVETRKDSE